MGTTAALMISYQRGGGWRPPFDREALAIWEDGTWTMWRTVASATYPPTAIGRFKGTLSGLTELRHEVASARAVGNYQQRSSPDSSAESITLSDCRADLGIHDLPSNAWAPLANRLRGLLLSLTEFPTAALTIQVAQDGQQVQLIRLGHDPLRLDLNRINIHAALWKPAESVTISEWDSEPLKLGEIVETEAGWTQAIPLAAGFKLESGMAVHASAKMRLFDGDMMIDGLVSN